MGNKKSKVTEKCNETKQTLLHSLDVKSGSQKANVRRMQDVLLIWLDQNLDNKSAHYYNTIKQFRQVMNDVEMLTDIQECIQFIRNINDIRICIITSGSLGKNMITHIHSMSQVNSIIIYCKNPQYHEQWSKDWTKIKGVYTEISAICEVLKQVTEQCEQNAISMSFIETNETSNFKKNLTKLDPVFLYSQILKEILSTIKFNDGYIKQFLDYCSDIFNGNDRELQNVKRLQKKYYKETPIWWYTCDSFLCPMLNRGIRMIDMDIIIEMGFFINDLHHHIKRLHMKRLRNRSNRRTFIVYRGQGMSLSDFDQMKNTQGGLLCFNNFLSTSTNKQNSLSIALRNLQNVDTMGILFIMKIDTTKSSIPFTSTAHVGRLGNREDEILFSMHTIFRIGEITPVDGNSRLFEVKLTLISDDDKDLRTLTNHIREESDPNEKGWYRLGLLLHKMGESLKAQRVYEILLQQAMNMNDKACIFYMIGNSKYNQREYAEAIEFYIQALEIFKTLPSKYLNLASSYYSIGNAYSNMVDYPKALSYYEKALEIWKQSLIPNHPNFASSYSDIGLVYSNMGDYQKALVYYEIALEIRKLSLVPNHPDFAYSYNSIGNVYFKMGAYAEALSSHEKALEIRKELLPENHPDLAFSYNNIGNAYSKMGYYSTALLYYEKALELWKQSFPSNHPHLAYSYNNIGEVYKNMGDYSNALSNHENALEIWKQSLPSTHPHLAYSYNNIGEVYRNMGDYPKALSYYEQAIEIWKQSLPSNHPDLSTSYNNIGNVYRSMKEFSKALAYHERALEMRKQALPSNHPDLAYSYDNLGKVYREIGDYSNALASHEKALEIRTLFLADHPDLGMSYNSIGLVHENIGDHSQAYSCYERAIKIGQPSLPADHPRLKKWKKNLDSVKEKL